MTYAVRNTPELQRVLALPRRTADGSDLVEDFTAALRREGACKGSAGPEGLCTVCRAPTRLRPAQALALHDIGTLGGAFCPMVVGGGKTLVSLLAPYVLDAQRPILLLPAALLDKTREEAARLAGHWLVPNSVRLLSYEMLGRVQSEALLEDPEKPGRGHMPDLVVCDEVQKLKNHKAAVTRRVSRYLGRNPDARFVALSGTLMDRSLLEFAHLLRWSLGDGAPVPRTLEEIQEWALALDERVDEWDRWAPGALAKLAGGATDLPSVRRGFQRRLLETPGVVATFGDADTAGCSILIRALPYAIKPETDDLFGKLRDTMRTPDEWQLEQGVDVWRHSRELALGYHSVWDPRPPEAWRQARRAWFAFVRDVLSRSRSLDSPEHVAQACDAGALPGDVLEAWRAIRDTFAPNVVPVWHDDSALDVCRAWMRKPGIVWSEHVPFARRLAELTGAPYYGEGGLAADGSSIKDGDPKRAVIASSKACREGFNLQTIWSRNLITAPAERPGWWQQLIGRTHRPGQTADEVTVDVLLGCREHDTAFRRALAAAEAVRDTMGASQKLLLADVAWPDNAATDEGNRWGANQ